MSLISEMRNARKASEFRCREDGEAAITSTASQLGTMPTPALGVKKPDTRMLGGPTKDATASTYQKPQESQWRPQTPFATPKTERLICDDDSHADFNAQKEQAPPQFRPRPRGDLIRSAMGKSLGIPNDKGALEKLKRQVESLINSSRVGNDSQRRGSEYEVQEDE